MTIENKTYANEDVLEFYKEMPFNYKDSVDNEVVAVKDKRPEDLYPGLDKYLSTDISVLEVGCGVGWLSNSMSYLYGANVTGIDFNPKAIARSQQVAARMQLSTRFLAQDVFLYNPVEKFDLVVSFGVLHHTNNCQEAVRKLCKEFVKPGGHVIIGLYHEYGRKPFLDYFQQMKDQGATAEEMLNAYKRLQSHITDETQIISWFRDQVLHPFETQHTLKEMLPILQETGMELVSTSINRFAPIDHIENVLAMEENYFDVGKKWLNQERYFPGFYIFIAKKL